MNPALRRVVISIIERGYEILSIGLNGYEYKNGNTHGVVAVRMPQNDATPYATWEFTDYTFWGHYLKTGGDVIFDFSDRIRDVCGSNPIRVEVVL